MGSSIPVPTDCRSPLTSTLRSVQGRLKANAVAAYVSGTRSNWLLLADHVVADAGVGAPFEEVELEEELAGLLGDATAPVNGNRLPCPVFFDRKTAPDVHFFSGEGSCIWAPVRWEGRLAGGLVLVPSSRRGLSSPELAYLSTVAGELARKMRIQQLMVHHQRFGDSAAREQLVLMHLPLVDRICRRFASSTVAAEDLRQVGAVALLTAVERYDPQKGHDFVTFATPCIVGELKNYFRDCTSPLKVPRALRRLGVEIKRRTQHLAQELGRFPTVDEIALALETPRQSVIEALALDQNIRPLSIDTALDKEGALRVSDLLAEEDPDLEGLCDRSIVRDAIARLGEVDKAIVLQRFYEEQTQAQVGERLGISQAHVSRLERSALLKIKMTLADGWL